MNTKRIYFIKLPFEFYERPEVVYIMRQKNGFEILTIFQRLIMMSAEREGYLRFTENEPYTAETLADILRTSKETMDSALTTLHRFQMIETLDNGTIRVNDIEDYILSESIWAEKKRTYRQNQKPKGQKKDNVLNVSETEEGQRPIDIDTDIDIDVKEEEDKNINIVSPRAGAHVLEEVVDFCNRKCRHVKGEQFFQYNEDRDWKIRGEDIKDWRSVALEWDRQLEVEERTKDILPLEERMKLKKEYQNKFGVELDFAYYSRPKMVRYAICTNTPLPQPDYT